VVGSLVRRIGGILRVRRHGGWKLPRRALASKSLRHAARPPFVSAL
jgi:hypothetical protein